MAYLPDIPFDIPESLQNLLVEMKLALESIQTDPTPPGQPTMVTLLRVYPGILVQWNPALKAKRYYVYRNVDDNSFHTASIRTVLFDINNVSYFDLTQELSPTSVLYYWIQAENAAGIKGPLSAMMFTVNSVAPFPGTVTSIPDTIMPFITADPDEWGDTIGLAGDDLGSDSVAIWAYTEGDEDFWITNDLSGYAVP